MVIFKRSRVRDGKAELRRVLGDLEVPTVPELVAVAIEQVSAPDGDLREVAETIALDPGTAAKLLSVVNSAAFAPRTPIIGVAHAVTMMGKNRLESMLISLAVSSAVARKRIPGFDMHEFWRIAAWRASAASALARRVDRARSTEAFTAALLQDIAVPLLVAGQPGYSSVLDAWRNGGCSLEDLEASRFGWTHLEVAGWLFDEWGFPRELCDAVSEASRPDGAYAVVRVVSSLNTRGSHDDVVAATAERIVAAFGFDEAEAVELLESAYVDGAHLARYLG